MNGGVAGGALAAGDAGKPGAPEDAARARGYPEVEDERWRVRPPRVAGDHVTVPAAQSGKRPFSLPYPQLAVSGRVTCLLARRASGAIAGLGGRGRSHTRRS